MNEMNDNELVMPVLPPASPTPAHPASRAMRHACGLVAALILIAFAAYAWLVVHRGNPPAPPAVDGLRQRLERETQLPADPIHTAQLVLAPSDTSTVRIDIGRSAAIPVSGYPCTGFGVEELGGDGTQLDPRTVKDGFEARPRSRWKVTLRGDLDAAKDAPLATVILVLPESRETKPVNVLLPPALTEIQVVNKYDDADYTHVRIAGPQAPDQPPVTLSCAAPRRITAAELTPTPALLNLPPQPFPEKTQPLRIPVAGRGPWHITCTGCRLGDHTLPTITGILGTTLPMETPPPISGCYSLIAPMTRFPDGPDNPRLETTQSEPIRTGDNYEVDYFNEMVYLPDDTVPRQFRADFKNHYLPNTELPHFLGVVMDLDLKNSNTPVAGKMTVLLTYPHAAFIQYQGDVSVEKKSDGTLKLRLSGHQGFAGGNEHEGINAWSAEYIRLIQTKERAALKRFMDGSLADWVAYQYQTHETPEARIAFSLDFSKWDYLADTTVMRFDTEARHGTLWMKKAVLDYPIKILYYGHDQTAPAPYAVGAVLLKQPVAMNRNRN